MTSAILATPNYRATQHTSDGVACFWLVHYKVTPLVQTVTTDHDEQLHSREVNVVADHQPTIAEAYTTIPTDEQARVTQVSVKPMHPNHLGNAFVKGHNFTDLHTGDIGPLAIRVERNTTVEDHLTASKPNYHFEGIQPV